MQIATRKALNIGAYCVITLVPFALLAIPDPPWIWSLVGAQLVLLGVLFFSQRSLFAHAFYWLLFAVAIKLRLIWPIPFIVPLVIYLILIFGIRSLRVSITWIKWGTINKQTVAIMLPVMIVSSLGLILWVVLFKPNLEDLERIMPAGSPLFILVAGMAFSVFNAIWEEAILKGILWNGLEQIFASMVVINIVQAVLFGYIHYNGFPRGIVGTAMAAAYGFMIGIVRKKSQGMLAPILAHTVADATIFGILVFK